MAAPRRARGWGCLPCPSRKARPRRLRSHPGLVVCNEELQDVALDGSDLEPGLFVLSNTGEPQQNVNTLRRQSDRFSQIGLQNPVCDSAVSHDGFGRACSQAGFGKGRPGAPLRLSSRRAPSDPKSARATARGPAAPAAECGREQPRNTAALILSLPPSSCFAHVHRAQRLQGSHQATPGPGEGSVSVKTEPRRRGWVRSCPEKPRHPARCPVPRLGDASASSLYPSIHMRGPLPPAGSYAAARTPR